MHTHRRIWAGGGRGGVLLPTQAAESMERQNETA